MSASIAFAPKQVKFQRSSDALNLLLANSSQERSGSFSPRSLLHIKNAPPDVCAPELTSSQERSPRIMRSGAQFISRALRQVSTLRISLHPKSPPPDFCAPELTSSQERSARCLRSGADFISRALRHMFALRSQLTSRALRQIFALRVDQNVLRSQILRSGFVATVVSLPLFFRYWFFPSWRKNRTSIFEKRPKMVDFWGPRPRKFFLTNFR